MRTGLDHQALRFDDTEHLVGVVATVAQRALQQDSPVLAVFPDDLIDRIRQRVGDTSEAIDVLPYDSCYDVAPQTLARFVDTVLGFVADGRRPTLMGGAMLVHREPTDVLAWMHMEAVLNDALAESDAHLLCCFPSTGLDPWVATAAMSTHRSMLVDGATVASATYVEPPAFLAAHPEPPPPALGEPDTASTFDRATLRSCRLRVTEHAARAGVLPTRVEELVMAVNEAMTNTVEHGPGTGTLRMWADRHGVTCEVHDTGQLAEPYLGLLPPTPSSPRGRGLWLIRQLPDRTQLWSDDAGTTIRMTVHADTGA